MRGKEPGASDPSRPEVLRVALRTARAPARMKLVPGTFGGQRGGWARTEIPPGFIRTVAEAASSSSASREHPIRHWPAITLVLAIGTAPVAAQETPDPGNVAGCYDLRLGEWDPPIGGGEQYHTPPDTILLSEEIGRAGPPFEAGRTIVRPIIEVRGDASAAWSYEGEDSVRVTWTNGFAGVRLYLDISADQPKGVAEARTDAVVPDSMVPTTHALLAPVRCPPDLTGPVQPVTPAGRVQELIVTAVRRAAERLELEEGMWRRLAQPDSSGWGWSDEELSGLSRREVAVIHLGASVQLGYEIVWDQGLHTAARETCVTEGACPPGRASFLFFPFPMDGDRLREEPGRYRALRSSSDFDWDHPDVERVVFVEALWRRPGDPELSGRTLIFGIAPEGRWGWRIVTEGALGG